MRIGLSPLIARPTARHRRFANGRTGSLPGERGRYSRPMNRCDFDRLNTPRAWAMDLAGFAATGAVLGVVGPFGSYFNDALPMRVAYWTGLFVVSGIVFGAGVRWIWPRAQARRVRPFIWVPLLVALADLPLSLVGRSIAVALWPPLEQALGWGGYYAQSLLVGTIYTGLYVAWRSRSGSAPVLDAQAEAPPDRLGPDLICLQMEDHYVRAHLEQGSRLVLMTLSQAMARTGQEGLQVHRSWWVARRAVTATVRDGRNLRLRLSNGIEAPVARAAVARLRAAGWLDDQDRLSS
ncbi:MAG: LytTR family transcriptional regulator [Brevundimonas sp.]|nr:MAG: LytTR family transcriptional regulator [Brevundimonas sp.]